VLTPEDEIIRYDGRTLAVITCPVVQVEAQRGRRWRWFGKRGWWVNLHFFHGWKSRKFVLTLAEAGVFLKHDPDQLPWLMEEMQRSGNVGTQDDEPSGSSAWSR
jgi:hypothetical protein